jgi:hypothetical protein
MYPAAAMPEEAMIARTEIARANPNLYAIGYFLRNSFN